MKNFAFNSQKKISFIFGYCFHKKQSLSIGFIKGAFRFEEIDSTKSTNVLNEMWNLLNRTRYAFTTIRLWPDVVVKSAFLWGGKRVNLYAVVSQHDFILLSATKFLGRDPLSFYNGNAFEKNFQEKISQLLKLSRVDYL